MHGKPGFKKKKSLKTHSSRMCSPLFFSPFCLTLVFLQHSPSFLHECFNNRRSVFQWKPLINNNLHLKCNLILTTCALFVNWILFLKDKAGRGLALADVEGQLWPARLNSSFTSEKSDKGQKSDSICVESFPSCLERYYMLILNIFISPVCFPPRIMLY